MARTVLTMSFLAFVLIFFSAILHVTWNTIAKKSRMSVALYAFMEMWCLACWGHALLWTSIPLGDIPLRGWCFILGAAACDTIYCLGLEKAYARLEMSVAYPVMRSLPLLFTALLTSFLGFGTSLPWHTILGVGVVFCGCLLMPMTSIRDFSLKTYVGNGFPFVLLVAAGTTGYTIFDREAQVVLAQAFPGTAPLALAITYYALRISSLLFLLMVINMSTASRRRQFRGLFRDGHWKSASLAGICASITYVLVLLAMNFVTNVTYVQCFRQIGLIFGVFGGIFFLHEKACMTKFAGVLIIIIGLFLTALNPMSFLSTLVSFLSQFTS